MQTILLICDDDDRRAELHRLLISDFEVYAASSESAAYIKRKICTKDFVIVEEENMGADKKISIHPLSRKEIKGVVKIIKLLLDKKLFINLVLINLLQRLLNIDQINIKHNGLFAMMYQRCKG